MVSLNTEFLLHCPCCGGGASIIGICPNDEFSAICTECGLETAHKKTPDAAAADWNKRYAPDEGPVESTEVGANHIVDDALPEPFPRVHSYDPSGARRTITVEWLPKTFVSYVRYGDRKTWHALPPGNETLTPPAQQPGEVGEVELDAVLNETLKMVDAFNPPPPGSYNRGRHEGIVCAVKTIRDLIPRAKARTYPFAALAPKEKGNG